MVPPNDYCSLALPITISFILWLPDKFAQHMTIRLVLDDCLGTHFSFSKTRVLVRSFQHNLKLSNYLQYNFRKASGFHLTQSSFTRLCLLRKAHLPPLFLADTQLFSICCFKDTQKHYYLWHSLPPFPLVCHCETISDFLSTSCTDCLRQEKDESLVHMSVLVKIYDYI